MPGLSVLLARRAPRDRLVRFHARQATWVVLPFFVLILAVGVALQAQPAARVALSPVAAALFLGMLVACLVGGVSAARGRFVRIRPVWDLLAR